LRATALILIHFVMTGLVPVISIQMAKLCHGYRDRRVKLGDDK
jgi:hypothetical protein